MNRYLQGESNYDKWPLIKVKNVKQEYPVGWESIAKYLLQELNKIQKKQKLIVIECYQGVLDEEIIPAWQYNLQGRYFFSKDCMLDEDKVDSNVYPDVTDDEVFGYITRLTLKDFFDPSKTEAARRAIQEAEETMIVYGPGACLLCPEPDLLIYADMPRWEIQQRFRKNKISNLGARNKELQASLQYKRAFFVDWRVCDRMKKQ